MRKITGTIHKCHEFHYSESGRNSAYYRSETELLKWWKNSGGEGRKQWNSFQEYRVSNVSIRKVHFIFFRIFLHYFGKSDGEIKIHNSNDLCMYLLNTAHVSSVMGDAFGEPKCIRFSFANSMTNIEKAWKRIADALAKLMKYKYGRLEVVEVKMTFSLPVYHILSYFESSF